MTLLVFDSSHALLLWRCSDLGTACPLTLPGGYHTACFLLIAARTPKSFAFNTQPVDHVIPAEPLGHKLRPSAFFYSPDWMLHIFLSLVVSAATLRPSTLLSCHTVSCAKKQILRLKEDQLEHSNKDICLNLFLMHHRIYL